MARFIGRKKELDGLRGLLKKESASLVVIKGRRRIGKSRLAKEFSTFFPKSYLLTGAPPEKGVTAATQREEFARQLRRLRIPVTPSDDWGDLLTDLAEHCLKGRVLVILDEITWMGGLDPTFLPKLKIVWDTHFQNNPKLVLVLTGSNSAWIDKNILSSTGFLGRVSYELYLKELPLSICSQFWGANQDLIAPYEKFKLLAITGGVPRYLQEIRPDLSAEQNLLSLCFQPSGILFKEFERIFSDLFSSRNQTYKEIVRQIANGQTTISKIAKGMGRAKGGDFSRYLDELIEAGFVSRDGGWLPESRKETRKSHYRISDNYVRFYLKYIEPYHDRIQAGHMQALPKGWTSIMGLQFENLVCNNSSILLEHLGISPNDVVWSGPFWQASNARTQGCQVDYLIQTEHRVFYLCEVKFLEQPIPFSIVNQVKDKVNRLAVPRGFSQRFVLIHVNGVAERVEHDPLFSSIIDFGQLLN